jgi:hypothetical protein
MRFIIPATATLLGVVLAGPLPASAMTGNQAIELMTGNRDADLHLSTYSKAIMDAEGVVRFNTASVTPGADIITPFCTPNAASAAQAAAIVRKELLSHPENNHQDLYIIARRALLKAWPCAEYQKRN